jgi:hypothetical protein
MKKFTTRLVLFSVVVFATVSIFYIVAESTFNDRFYSKFLHKSNGLVLGSSRALLGLNPEAIADSCVQAEGILNFAFTQKTSPYGEVYYNAICNKLQSNQTNGLFILEVSPLSLSAAGDAQPEKKLVLGEMFFFNLNPNPEYVFRNAQHPLYLDAAISVLAKR